MNLWRRKLSKNFPLRSHEFTSSDASQHKLSFCIEGAIFYQDCCGISVTINKWLDYLESLTADIRGVGRDWWTWGEMRERRELHLRCVIIVNWLLRRSFQFCFGCKLEKWERWCWDEMMESRRLGLSITFLKSVLTSSSQSHSLSYNVPHLTFSERK